MKKIALLSLMIGFVLNVPMAAHAFKLVILTNQPGQAKALEVQTFMKSLAPFRYMQPSELEIDIESIDIAREGISCAPLKVKYDKVQLQSLQAWSDANHVNLTKADMKKYKKGYEITRNVDCDRSALARIGARFGADQSMFILDHEGSGGSGGDVPILYSGSLKMVAVHELLHTFGMADEYSYSREEAPAFCAKSTWTNVAIFEDRPPYAGNADAVARHGLQIQWLPTLGSKPDLTTGTNLGTAYYGHLGLYPAKTCSAISMKSWKATPFPSIMESLASGWIPKSMWPPILTGMRTPAARQAALMRKAEDSTKNCYLLPFGATANGGIATAPQPTN